MEPEHNLYAREVIYRMLTTALIKKVPLPPPTWSVVKLDQEVSRAGREYESNLRQRHWDALITCVYYLVDFACQMPERVNLSLSNSRVSKMCGELADEVEQITYEPDAVIARHGKLKSWLKAILAVQTCWIYREETERVIAEEAESKHLRRITRQPKLSSQNEARAEGKWQSALAKSIFQKASMRKNENQSDQPSLF